jgi:DNA-binding response OmpR family regulator
LTPAKPLESKRILFVDDDADIRKMFRIVLEAAGALVLDAGTQAEATVLLRASPVDAVVLDWHLAGDSPAELLTTIGSTQPELRSRVLIVTGDPRIARPGASVLPAGISVLAKPFRPAELVVALQSLFDAA